MPETSPRIAVVIPCFNDGPLALEAVASIEENELVEIVVVDDGSSDPATLAALAQLEAEGVQVLRQANGGLAAARMAGAAATVARYVFPLDADDLAVSGALAKLADALDANPRAGMAYGDYAQFGDWDGIFPTPKTFDRWALTYGNPYGACSLIRRTALDAVGGWQSGLGYEDWDLWMAFAEAGWGGVRIDGLAYRRRLHGLRRQGNDRRQHRVLYRQLQRRHPTLFTSRHALRDDSPLPTLTKLLYPLLLSARQLLPYRLDGWLVKQLCTHARRLHG
jgi:glycosyltransferase involved in cell wall biosynthesis